MHTDEYEISLGREVVVCRSFVKRLKKAIEAREKKHGMTTEAFIMGFEEGRHAGPDRDFPDWHRDHRELQIWQKRLGEYEEAIRSLKDA